MKKNLLKQIELPILLAVCFLTLSVMSAFATNAGDSSSKQITPKEFCQNQTDFEALRREFKDPPREFTLMPFWFWNDRLTEQEIIRQIDDFEKHGVYGFTIHPRIGLPRETTWLGQEMINMMRTALTEAQKRKMYVMLYDDGMYPSGSASGQVVAENPEYAARGFVKYELKKGEKLPPLEKGAKKVSVTERNDGGKTVIYDQFSNGRIRGIHFAGPENVKNPREELPPAADLLNPKAVQCFIRLVYQRYYDEFKSYFDNGVIVGIFTDEPSILGRGAKRGMVEGNLGALKRINEILGRDFTPCLPELWKEDSLRQKEFRQAVEQVLEETYYGQISQWCREHKVYFAGHPAKSSDLGLLRKMDIPGQDIVWRYIEPGEKAFDPTHSMMGKVTSSAMLHAGKRRNLNEVYGAYGHEFTFKEMVWIANWCFVRGHNMLLPHAFFYSIRGPRLEERPPDVGPNSPWWGKYKPYADFCRRLSWLNTDSCPWIRLAILADAHNASALGTQALFENQIDFNYLELRDLTDRASLDKNSVKIAQMRYDLLILPPVDSLSKKVSPVLEKLADAGSLIRYRFESPKLKNVPLAANDEELIRLIRKKLQDDIRLTSAEQDGSVTKISEAKENFRRGVYGIRVRHVVKKGYHFYILFNEVDSSAAVRIHLSVSGEKKWWNPNTGDLETYQEGPVLFKPFELKILGVSPSTLTSPASNSQVLLKNFNK